MPVIVGIAEQRMPEERKLVSAIIGAAKRPAIWQFRHRDTRKMPRLPVSDGVRTELSAYVGTNDTGLFGKFAQRRGIRRFIGLDRPLDQLPASQGVPERQDFNLTTLAQDNWARLGRPHSAAVTSGSFTLLPKRCSI